MRAYRKMFVKLDGKGRVIPGTNVFDTSAPRVGKWIEINSDECCSPSSTSTSTTTNIPVESFARLEITIPEGGATLEMYYEGDATTIHVDWGDGVIENAPVVGNIYSHPYIEGIYQATFNTNYISLGSNTSIITSVIDLVDLVYIDLNNTAISELDATNSISLIFVSISGCTSLVNLYLNGCTSLTDINLYGDILVTSINLNDTLLSQESLDILLTTLTDLSYSNLVTINLTVQNNIRPTQPVIDAFVLAHPDCTLTLNP